MTAALEGGEWSAARPGRTLPPGKTRYPLYRRLGGPQGRSGRAENLVPTGIRSRTVQPVASRYTDWATRPKIKKYNNNNIHTVHCYCVLESDNTFIMMASHHSRPTMFLFVFVCVEILDLLVYPLHNRVGFIIGPTIINLNVDNWDKSNYFEIWFHCVLRTKCNFSHSLGDSFPLHWFACPNNIWQPIIIHSYQSCCSFFQIFSSESGSLAISTHFSTFNFRDQV